MTANDVRTTLETSEGIMLVSLPQDGKKALEEVIWALGHNPAAISQSVQEEIGKRLSEMVHKDPPWGRSYISNILHGHQEAGQKFIEACYRLGAVIDDTPVIIAQSTPVNVMAVGNIQPGSLILADSRPCANPGCRLEFVPRVPWQMCHSSECARIYRTLRQAQGPKRKGGK